MTTTVAKACCICGVDVSQAKRVRDLLGHYYCHPCYERHQHDGERQTSVAPTAPPSRPVATAPASRTPANGKAETTIIIVGSVIGLLIVGGLLYFLFLRGRWENKNREHLLALAAEAATLVSSNKLDDGRAKYQELFDFLGDRTIRQTDLKQRLDVVRSQQAAVLQKLAERDVVRQKQDDARRARQDAERKRLEAERQQQALIAKVSELEKEAKAELPQKRRALFQQDPAASFKEFAERFVNGVRTTKQFTQVDLTGTDVQRTKSVGSYIGTLEFRNLGGAYEAFRLAFVGRDGEWELREAQGFAGPFGWKDLSGLHGSTWSEAARVAEKWPYN